MNVIWIGVFLLCCFAISQYVVDPRLLYQGLAPLFYWGSEFVAESARQPGGLLSYAARN